MRNRAGGRFAIAVIATVAFVLLAAASGSATDGFTSPVRSVAVAAGGSVSAAQTVHLDALPAKADIVLPFDTTGSMGDLLTDAKSDAASIVSSLQTEFPVAGALRFAIVDFRDYGGTDYPFRA